MTEENAAQGEAPVDDAGAFAGAFPGAFPEAAAEMANETEVEVDPSFTDHSGDAGDGGDVGEAQVAALTADLQRLQAEYLNYKRRVDRDRDLVRENATYAVLAPITEVLDTIDRAREHGELEGGLKTVAEQLERVVSAQGLTKFGEPGDAFDPTLHEALSHIGEDPEVSVTTCKIIAKAGYRIGARVVRAAQVLVVDPAATVAQPSEPQPSDPAEEQSEGR